MPNSESDTLDSVDNDENVIGGKLGELGKVCSVDAHAHTPHTNEYTHIHPPTLSRISTHAHALARACTHVPARRCVMQTCPVYRSAHGHSHP